MNCRKSPESRCFQPGISIPWIWYFRYLGVLFMRLGIFLCRDFPSFGIFYRISSFSSSGFPNSHVRNPHMLTPGRQALILEPGRQSCCQMATFRKYKEKTFFTKILKIKPFGTSINLNLWLFLPHPNQTKRILRYTATLILLIK